MEQKKIKKTFVSGAETIELAKKMLKMEYADYSGLDEALREQTGVSMDQLAVLLEKIMPFVPIMKGPDTGTYYHVLGELKGLQLTAIVKFESEYQGRRKKDEKTTQRKN